jgi:HAD superfamily hydrolase (TIGR01509 family)
VITRPPRALLLDLDGTLIDSLPALRSVYDTFLTSRGATPTDAEFAALNGPPLPEIVRRLAERHGFAEPLPALQAAYAAAVGDAYATRTEAFPGARTLLLTARRHGLRVTIVTGCPEALARSILRRLGLASLVWGQVDSHAVPTGKPAGDIYRLALARTEVDAFDALAVEDAPNGLAAARAAGVPVLDAAVGLPAIAAALDAACRARSFILWPGLPARVVRLGDVDLGAEAEARCAAVFAEARAARGRELFDGPVDFLARWTPAGLGLRRGAYRHYLAARADAELAARLGPTVAVSGLIRSRPAGHVLWGRRGPNVTQYPDHWELVPAGGLGGAPELGGGEVDWRVALTDELREEAGLVGSVEAPLGLVFDTVDPVVDLCAALVVEGVPQPTTEYPTLAWHSDATVPTPTVPTSAALVAEAAAPGHLRPAAPEDLPFVLALRNRPENVARSNRPRTLGLDELPSPTSPDVRMWILETPAGPAGHLTAQLERPTAWLGLALRPELQGRGLGPLLLRAACARLAAEGIAEAAAHIFADNAPSRGAFTRAGFSQTDRETLADGRVRETWRHTLSARADV